MTLEQSSHIMNLWPILAALITLVAWLIRLEAKVLYHEKEMARLEREQIRREQQHKDTTDLLFNKLDAVQSTLNQVLASMGELKGRLESKD